MLPRDLGLPSSFSKWRIGQEDAIRTVASSTSKRFVILAMPTGSGKSVCNVGAGQMIRKSREVLARIKGQGEDSGTVILTSTKALQDQYMRDFREMGMVTVKGKNAYACRMLEGQYGESTCDFGPCRWGTPCGFRAAGCRYYDAVRVFANADLSVTNYAFWYHYMRAARKGEEEIPAPVSLLVLDEAHDVAENLVGLMEVVLKPRKLTDVLEKYCAGLTMDGYRMPGTGAEELKQFSQYTGGLIGIAVRALSREQRGGTLNQKQRLDLRFLENQKEAVDTIQNDVDEDTWIIQEGRADEIKLAPMWPGTYSERIFAHVGKVILSSATIRPKTVELLGVKEGEMTWMEGPSSFPVARRPVVYAPTVRMNFRMTDGEHRDWMTRIDQIIGARLDRKGIIHTVSYQRAEYIIRNSEYSDLMVPLSRTALEMVMAFKAADPPVILVSPSVSTGFDFPGDQCRYQIIAKVPFPDTQDPVVKFRSKMLEGYATLVACQTLVQAAGRSTRAEDDWSEVFILDKMFGWVVMKHKSWFPKWFLDAVVWKWEGRVSRPLEVGIH